MKVHILLILFLGLIFSNSINAQNKQTLSGYIKDAKNGESMIGASIAIKELSSGTLTNEYGYYAISLPPGTYTVVFSYVGYEAQQKTIVLNEKTTLNIELSESATVLEEVKITDKVETGNVTELKMSTEKMSVEMIRKLPQLFGEVDVIRTLMLLPGIQNAGEGTTGFYVRGGGQDQNLILLDEAPVYNASHFLGFFSVFNSDAIKDVEIYKGGIPAQYGGRLASLLDIRMKEGNNKKFSGSGGIGTISSRLTLEAPIVKDKSSFMVSGRRTYADLFLKMAPNKAIRDNSLYFYDLNTKVNYTINEKNRLYLSGYFGRDNFSFADVFSLGWGNATGTLRWNHLYSDKLFSNTTVYFSNYDYALTIDAGVSNFKWSSNMQEGGVKQDFTWYANQKHRVQFGAQGAYRVFKPGKLEPTGDNSLFQKLESQTKYGAEYAVYISDKYKMSSRIALEYGLRFSAYQNFGPGTVWQYQNNDSSQDTTGSKVYERGDVYQTYMGLEPRLAGMYLLNDVSSVKINYNRTRQYIQLASNSTSALPTDIWIPSSPYIKPQISDQIAAGYFRNFRNNRFEASAEVYVKSMQNQVDFRDNAQVFFNERIEAELRHGSGRAYGTEWMVKKQQGNTTGWVSYTLSRTERRIIGINEDQWFPARYDRTHSANFILTHQFSKRLSASFAWVYATGNAVTFPAARYQYNGQIVPLYTERNGFRMPAYHRGDLSATLNSKEKENRKWSSNWNFSVYNIYLRKNAFSIYFRQNKDNPQQTEAVMVYLFGIIPSVTYNFNF
jgi:hypothetical protein